MSKALTADPRNLSDRKLWELLRSRAAEISQREREGVDHYLADLERRSPLRHQS